MTLFAPGEIRLGRGAIPIEIRGGTPFVEATLRQGGRRAAGRFLIDTGATSAATVYADFVSANPWLLPARILPLTGGALLPGQFRAAVGRVDRLSFGGFAVTLPVVNFSSSAGADDAAEGDAGQIGGEILSRYTITLDYAHRRMSMRRGERREPYRFDASGVSFATEPPAFEAKRVRLVLPGTPAAEAGLERGDRLLAIDGMPAGPIPIQRLREMLRLPGRVHRLDILREGQPISVTLRTRTLV
jgi:hypothetical protein